MLTEVVAAGLFAAVAIVVPGIVVQYLLCRRVDPALVLPVGFVVCAAVYALALVSGVPWIFPLACAAAAVVVAVRGRALRMARGPAWSGAVPPVVALLIFLSVTRYPMNRRDASGDFLMDAIYVADATFHVGLTWELTLGYPPEVPGLSGFPFSYHFGSHLVRAAALRWAGLHPYASLARLEPTLGALALLLVWRALAFRIGLRGLALALAPWGLLAADASFWLALVPGAQFWVEHLKGNLLTSLVLANSVVPALALAAGVLIAYDRYRHGEGRGWLALALVLAMAVPFFKVFLAAPLLAGLGWMFWRDRPHRRAVVALAGVTGTVLAALAWAQPDGTVEVVLDPLAFVRATASAFGFATSGAVFAALVVLWLVSSLGLRVAGVPAAFRALHGSPVASAAAVIALVGWPVALLLRISPAEDPSFNESFYFLEASGAVLWIFTAPAIAGWLSGARRGLVIGLVAALALPGTAEFMVRKWQSGARRVPAGVLDGLEALARDSAPGDVVLQRPHTPYPAPPLVFVGRRVPYTRVIPYFDQFAAGHEVTHRLTLVRHFFQTASVPEARAIAAALGARHLCIYGGEGVGFAWEELLEPIYESPDIHVYRIRNESTRGLPLRR